MKNWTVTVFSGQSATTEQIEVRQSSYRPEIDGLRALAVVAVIINHFNKNLLPSGYLGVDIFFVISGFVITSSLANRPSKSFGDFLLGFYSRRVRRIVPALVLFVIVTGILICIFHPEPRVMLGIGLRAIFGFSNIALYQGATDYFATSTELNVFTHTWSLGVEEQFYFIFPFLLWFSGFGRQTRKGTIFLFWIMGALAIASLTAFIYLSRTDQPAAYFLMPARFWELGTGCILFLFLQGRTLKGWVAGVPPFGVMGLLIAVLFIPLQFTVQATISVVLLTALLIASLRPETTAYDLLTHPHVVYIGLISYSLYLWHWSILSISRWTIGIHWWSVPIQVSFIFLLAAASYRFIEKPLRNAEWSALRWKSIGYGLCASVSAASLLLLLRYPLEGRLYTGNDSATKNLLEEFCLINASGDNADSISKSMFDRCVLPPKPITRQRILIMGDSHSSQYYPLLLKIRTNKGTGVAGIATISNPFLPQRYTNKDLKKEQWESVNKTRSHFFDKEFSNLKRGDLLLIASRIEYYFIKDKYDLGNLDKMLNLASDDWTSVNEKTAFSLWLGKLSSLAHTAENKGVNVVVFSPLPVFRGDDASPVEICRVQWFRPSLPDTCNYGEKRQKIFARVRPLADGLRQLSALHSNLFVYDPFPMVCPPSESICKTYRHGKKIFRDNDHLSADGALSLYDHFTTFLHRNHLLK